MCNALTRLALVLVFCSTSVALAAEKVELKLRLEEGKDYLVESVSDMTTQMQMMGMSQNMVVQSGTGLTFHVLKVDPKTGNMDVKVTYSWVSMKQQGGPTGPVSYDSRTHTGPVPPTAQGLAGLIGQGYEVTLDSKGCVVEVRGVQEFFDKMMEGMPAESRSMMEPMMKKQFGDSAMRATIEQATRIIPDRAVSPGESWQVQIVMGNPMPMTIDNTYTLKEVKGDAVVLDFTSNVKPAPAEQSGMELPGGGKMTIEVNGTQAGQITVDRKTGLLRSNTSSQDFTGTTTITNPQAPAPMVGTMTMKGTTTITRK